MKNGNVDEKYVKLFLKKKKFWELDFKCDFSFLVFLVEWNLDKCFKKIAKQLKIWRILGNYFCVIFMVFLIEWIWKYFLANFNL